MNAGLAFSLALAGFQAFAAPAMAQGISDGYRNYGDLQRSISRLRGDFGDLVGVETIAQSPGGRDIQAIRIASGDGVNERPALLVVANAFGPHLVGSEVAINVANLLASGYGNDSEVTKLLESGVVYIIPRANPDAAEAFFSSVVYEQVRNDGSEDEDHDWEVDEDGPEDLNGDGLITMMRVMDPTGEWIADEANPSLMRKAEREKGEVGMYRLLSEGTDNDGDEAWNEDGPGAVDVNANFTYKYDFFAAGSGVHQMSAAETRGIAEFFVAHPNIAAVYVLGPQDNVMEPWKHKQASGIGGNPEGTSAGGPYSSILSADQPFFERMGEQFEELTGMEGEPTSGDLKGDVLSWSYFHMGRWAFGSRVWWVPETAAETDEDSDDEATDEEEAEASHDEADGDDDSAEDAEQEETPDEHDSLKSEYNDYRWMASNVPGGFVEWTSVNHPDFPGQEVEVGGFSPYVRMNPPGSMLDSLSAGQFEFVKELMASLPQIELRNVEVENVGDRTYRINATVTNNGYFPTLSAIGVRAFWPRQIRLSFELDGQELIGGRTQQLLGPIPGGGGSREFSWLVVGRPGSNVSISASSPVAGTASQTLTLR